MMSRRTLLRRAGGAGTAVAIAGVNLGWSSEKKPPAGTGQKENPDRSGSLPDAQGRGNLRINALIFDAYGTLFDVNSVVSLGEQLFPGQGAALSQMWRTKQLEYSWLRSVMGHYEDFWQVTQSVLDFSCKALRLPAPPATQAKLMEAYFHLQPYSDVRGALRSLFGHTLSILSNGTPKMLEAVVKSSGLGNFFRHVMSVDALKIYKPSPRVYELATKTLGLEKSAIGFVSSNCWDAIGAKAFGFRTFWINRAGAPPDELGFAPDFTVKALTELPAALNTRV